VRSHHCRIAVACTSDDVFPKSGGGRRMPEGRFRLRPGNRRGKGLEQVSDTCMFDQRMAQLHLLVLFFY